MAVVSTIFFPYVIKFSPIILPANVTPEYKKAEERYLQARTLEERIKATEEMIRVAPKHKGSEKLLRTLKRRLAKLRLELEEKREKKVGRGSGPSFSVKKEGAAQIALVGLPNSGKSKILQDLTSARVEVAEYPFTTRYPIPGMIQFEDVQIQLVEVPAIVEGSSYGRGLGARPLSVARNADAIALVVDASDDPVNHIKILLSELDAVGVKLNCKPPKVSIEKRSSGGIEVKGAKLVGGGEAEIKRILQEHRIHNAFVVIEEPITLDEFEEALSESNVYLRGFVLLTKCDLPNAAEKIEMVKREFGDLLDVICTGGRPEDLKGRIYQQLDLIRVYTKKPDGKPAERPLVLPKGSTVMDVARSVHKDFAKGLKFARVWGSTKFPGQQVTRDYVLEDKDVVELHT
ncbi:MAG: OBG GTPase family GTP-binding protein [Candidatus Hadarchaeum sp.]|uniref:OBG GTPase family GTP-binding protein n=1 Tax=Candidatus Hadarchaeum sp. TaxID=2883567 RepID=UPI003D0D62ED